MVLDGDPRIVFLGQFQLRLELLEEGLHLGGEVVDLAVAGLADRHAPARLAEDLRKPGIPGIGPDVVAGERIELQMVLGEQVLEALGPQAFLDLVQVRDIRSPRARSRPPRTPRRRFARTPFPPTGN